MAEIKHFTVDEQMPPKDFDDFKGKDWGNNPVMVHVDSIVQEYRPIELHHVLHGSKNEKGAFVIMMVMPHQLVGKVYAMGQVSLDMLTKALDECGYTLTKK